MDLEYIPLIRKINFGFSFSLVQENAVTVIWESSDMSITVGLFSSSSLIRSGDVDLSNLIKHKFILYFRLHIILPKFTHQEFF